MVAFTPNRGYPYSQSTDLADVAGALEALARAVDADLAALDAQIVTRPFARVSSRSTTKQVFPSDQSTEATFDFVDADTDGISNLSVHPTRLTPTSPRFWFVWGAIETPFAEARARDVFLRRNGVDIGRYEFIVDDPTGSGGQMMTIGAMSLMNGTTDYFTMTFEPDQGAEDFHIGNKAFACFRLTHM